MMKTLLTRGMSAGVGAGLLAFAFASVFGESQIGHAISFGNHHLAHAMALVDPTARVAPAPVSRSVQSTIGLATGTCIYGLAFGGIFALVFAGVYGRVGHATPRTTAALLALAGFFVIILVPVLKYPANPPSIGNPATIAHRTELYFLMIAISLIAAIAGVRLYRAMVAPHGAWTAGLLAGMAYIAVIAVAQLMMPAVNEVPPGFPATVLWRFRIASLGTQLVLWSTIGIGFGLLAERALRQTATRASRNPPGTEPSRTA
ncbi:MAG: CbtA family protein [Actinomycetota bacterium]|nr:CbtA family protein [Actinomycetota bacterium]